VNRACVISDEVPLPVPKKAICAFAERVLDAINAENWHITIVFCSDTFIHLLNREYRKKDEPTDVLSFTTGEMRRGVFYAGDIVISVETLEQNAREFSVEKEEELRRIIIHGILHLSGMDHTTNNYEREAMLVLQEKLIKEIAWT
jgi:probable rRNA maturation factor